MTQSPTITVANAKPRSMGLTLAGPDLATTGAAGAVLGAAGAAGAGAL